nr:MAG TPA: hypothetical protein [Caudoviricetes sp.]
MVEIDPQFYYIAAELELKERFNNLKNETKEKLERLANSGAEAYGVNIANLDKEIYHVAKETACLMLKDEIIEEKEKNKLINHITKEMERVVARILDEHDVIIIDGQLQTREYTHLSGDSTLNDFVLMAGRLDKNEKAVFKFLRQESYSLGNAYFGIHTLERKINERIGQWEKEIETCKWHLCSQGMYYHMGRIIREYLELKKFEL